MSPITHQEHEDLVESVRKATRSLIQDRPLPQGTPKAEHTFTAPCDATVKPTPWYCGPDAGKPRLTPLEETIQRLMEPDKHGDKGRPARQAYCYGFSNQTQRTLDALWKFADGTAAADRENKDFEAQLKDRAEAAEERTLAEYDKRKTAEAKLKRLEHFAARTVHLHDSSLLETIPHQSLAIDYLRECLKSCEESK